MASRVLIQDAISTFISTFYFSKVPIGVPSLPPCIKEIDRVSSCSSGFCFAWMLGPMFCN